jgi:D-cysteine desulfhydrase
LITCVAAQSNHCRLTLAAAVKEGIKCRLVLGRYSPGTGLHGQSNGRTGRSDS